nr:hypothetical protein [uncultured Cupriavidus sp.]
MIDIANDAAASIEIHPNDLCSDSDATGTAMRPLTRLLAHHVLGAPQRNWTLDAFASVAGMTRPALSRRLFAEGTSFRESVRTHRLTRLLIDLSDCSLPAHTLSLRYGFADRCLLEDAVFEQYGLSLSRLKNIVGHTAPQRLLGTQEELPDLRRCVPALWQT